MLWIEKYKPKSFSEISSHHEITSMLTKYTLDTLPNLVLYGQIGHNKKTLLYALLEQLYGSYPSLTPRSIEIDTGSTKIPVTYYESDEVVEICPSEYGYRDRYVVQGIIKEIAQARPITSLFGTRKKGIRVLIIDQAVDLSRDAQAALRRTMEMYSDHFRIVMLCTEGSKLIDPIRSRCLMVRVRGFSDEEIGNICKRIGKEEGFSVDKTVVDSICKNAAGNGKRAISLFELYCFNNGAGESKRQKVDYADVKLEWETRIEGIAQKIKRGLKPETLIEMRKEVYSLLNSMIPPSVVLIELLKRVGKGSSLETWKFLVSFAARYEERMRLGTKPIYHLEAFIASAMATFLQKK